MTHKQNSLAPKHFTLIELLVVIAIIAILAGIALPGVNYAMKRARMTQARADIAHLVTAIKSYESTYHLLPVALTTDSNGAVPSTGTVWRATQDKTPPETDKTKQDSQRYDTLLQILSKVDITNSDATNVKNNSELGNPRNISFLDVPQQFNQKGFLDPWGNRYAIIFNSSYNRRGVNFGKWQGEDSLRGNVFVYSFGSNRTDEQGSNTSNGGTAKEDDICSWDVQ